MKKCEYTLQLIDHKGNIVWSRSERKKKICIMFVDEMLKEKWLHTDENKQDSLMTLLIHLEKRPDYGLQVLRAGIRRDDKE